MSARILVVEDDLDTRVMLVHRLQHAGHRVSQAANGKEALEILERETFDVVLTDIVMGTITGIDVLRAARSKPNHPEVIILTGHGTLDTAIEALRAGAYDYLLKPCNDETMMRCVEHAIQHHASEQQLQQAAQTIYAVVAGGSRVATEADQGMYAATGQNIHIGKLSVGRSRKEVFLAGRALHITPIEHTLLRYLAERAGQVCHSRDIVLATHGFEVNESEAQSLLRTHIRNLRRKLGPGYLVNDPGVGYTLVDPDKPAAS
jgi:DNA-binding response OmpR family regulator